MDKTNVIPYGTFFNPGCKICPDLDVKWVDNFKLLGIEIDNKLEKLNINFIDIHKEVFEKEKNPKKLFPFEMLAHYNEEGYKKVAETIYKFTKD